MLKEILARVRQGHRTIKFPSRPAPAMTARYRGRPELRAGAKSEACPEGCDDCAEACPTGALETNGTRLDLGKCLFCAQCSEACPRGAVAFTKDYRMAVRRREDLIVRAGAGEGTAPYELAAALEKRTRRLFGRSFKIRQVSAGGCNGCEADVNVLNTIGWDLGRFGIQFVASPRHADALLVTGPVTANMELALKKTYDAVPEPKLVIAVGSCAIAGGPYIDHPEARNGALSSLAVDLFVPGCPPHPLTILDGLLRLLGRIKA